MAPPLWWTTELYQQAINAAEGAAPLETCGLLLQLDGQISLCCFPAHATPWSCSAEPQSVIDFVYSLADLDGELIATFHSHPRGPAWLSERDQNLMQWASVHVLAYADYPEKSNQLQNTPCRERAGKGYVGKYHLEFFCS